MTQAANCNPILIVDDEPSMRTALSELLRRLGHFVVTAANAEEALKHCRDKALGAIITDMKMPGISGMELFEVARKRQPQTPFILMSAFGTIDIAVSAMKAGVSDYLVKPFSQETLEAVMDRALLGVKTTPPVNITLSPERAFLTQDTGMLKLTKTAQIVAASQATVLIEGESGTGKELLARFIHQHSPRSLRPFVAMNCAALPEGLLESELFGYEKGAFTGAVTKKPGRFEQANTGTILLDEVSELHPALQAKLLRVLQEREVDLLGGKGPIPLDIRVIATTNRPLWDEVQKGRFREDLYYRLNVFPMRIPPLRDRVSDIPLLIHHFLKKGTERNQKQIVSLTQEALSILMGREWRGNVRELENVLERAVLLAEEGIVGPDQLLFGQTVQTNTERSGPSGTTLWKVERNLILDTLDQVSGNRTHAARILGISIRTLRNKLREYGVNQPHPSLLSSSS